MSVSARERIPSTIGQMECQDRVSEIDMTSMFDGRSDQHVCMMRLAFADLCCRFVAFISISVLESVCG